MIKKANKTAYFVILVIMFINLCTISSIGAITKIESVKSVNVTVKLNEKYSLPKTVTVAMSDKSTKSVAVTWDKKTLDTSKIGTYTFKGTIKGYAPKVILIIKVIDPAISKPLVDSGKWSSKKDLPYVNEMKSSTSVSPGLTMVQENYDENKAVTCGNRIIYIHNDGKVKEYDPVNDIWTDKYEISGLKESNGDFKLVSVKNMVYIVGVNFSDVLVYDPATNNCSFKTKLPTERRIAGVVSVNDKIYILGGLDISKGCSIDSFDEYDPSTDMWTSKAHLNQAANIVLAAALNDSIYIISFDKKFNDTLEVYDFKKNSWSIKSTSQYSYRNESIEAVNGKIYILRRGADSKTQETILHVEEYNPITNIFTPRADTKERNKFSSVVFNGEIYIIGGMKDIDIPMPKNNQDLEKYFEDLKTMDPSERIEYIKTVEKYTPPKLNI